MSYKNAEDKVRNTKFSARREERSLAKLKKQNVNLEAESRKQKGTNYKSKNHKVRSKQEA